MSRRSFAAAAAFGALVLVYAGTGIGHAADQGRRETAAATKAFKQMTSRGRRGPRGAVGPTGPGGGAWKDGAAGKMGPAGKEGPAGGQGPGAVISMESIALGSSSVDHNAQFAFVGQTLTATFDARTTVQVTASLEFASRDGKRIEGAFGICAELAGGTEIFTFRAVNIEFQASAESYFAQTAATTLEGLMPGRYTIGACTARETLDTSHGLGTLTMIVAEGEGGR
jgi:hypothetical protein